MPENALQHLIYGHTVVSNEPSDLPVLLAHSAKLTADDLPQGIPLTPMPIAGMIDSAGFALLYHQLAHHDVPTSFWFTRSYYQLPDQRAPITQYIQIPADLFKVIGSDIQSLLAILDKPLPLFEVADNEVEPLILPSPTTQSLDRSVALLKSLLDEMVDGDMRLLLGILGSALQGTVFIQNFPQQWKVRMRLLRGLMLLLPNHARSVITFSTSLTALQEPLPRICFSELTPPATVQVIDWLNPQIPDNGLQHPYVEHLLRVWHDDMIALAETLRRLDTLAVGLMPGFGAILDELEAVVWRSQQDYDVSHHKLIAVKDALIILDSAMPPQDDLRLAYLKVLLEHALENRDIPAAERVSKEMDASPTIDRQLQLVLDETLDMQPDAVYAFVRVRLSSGMNDVWLNRLQRAADRALDVALQSGSADVVGIWLTLLAREPMRYELSAILRRGIMAAVELTTDHPNLARELLKLAVKRQPDAIPTLLQDSGLRDALPPELHAALIDSDPTAIEELAKESRELFLLAIVVAAEQDQSCISENTIRQLWDIHTQQQTNTLPPQYRPLTIMHRLADDGFCLMDGAVVTLLALILTDQADLLFYELFAPLTVDTPSSEILPIALEQSGRTPEDMMTIINQLLTLKVLDAQEVAEVYAALLQGREWDETTLPMVEQFARHLNQTPEVSAPAPILWKLVEISGELKSEQMMRVASRRLLGEISTMPAETQVIESMARLRKAISWSMAGRSVLIRWWRQYARSQGLGQLQKIDRALDGKRGLEDLRSVVQTTLALRRLIGQRTLAELADDISVTFNILQMLSEGFDPDEKPITIDSATLRGELDARSDEMPTDVRHVLATNLKELANLITSLAENRSKPSLMRSDESLERQLVTGEQQPQSAVDVMRWLSGYLDGVQKEETSE